MAELVTDIHRIGGGSIDNLRLKTAEARLSPPGISVLKADLPGMVAQQIKEAFPGALKLHELAKTIGSTSSEKIAGAGFDLIADPTRRLPNHFRIIHPDGVAGFSDSNLARLAAVFIDSAGANT